LLDVVGLVLQGGSQKSIVKFSINCKTLSFTNADSYIVYLPELNVGGQADFASALRLRIKLLMWCNIQK